MASKGARCRIALKSRTNFSRNFVRLFSATFRDFSAVNLQSKIGN